ncbi:hypothetical protein QJS10_CPA01g01565 [Acorus calamus]|uniref:Uncharacterized protein n=1 Tax=Acorus calamus TaxID=4465 RepID=A0AAV9FH56_ACOCL|nr:hypothetical protein QJS10_CPA01g01565 [Acorus calamus]
MTEVKQFEEAIEGVLLEVGVADAEADKEVLDEEGEVVLGGSQAGLGEDDCVGDGYEVGFEE